MSDQSSGDEDVAEALHAFFPANEDPDDITTWPADKLDELCVWDAAVNGYELVDEPPELELATTDDGNDFVTDFGYHVHNTDNVEEDHDYTAGDEFDPYADGTVEETGPVLTNEQLAVLHDLNQRETD